MKVTGRVASLDWNDRGAKLKLDTLNRTIWVSELQKRKVQALNLKQGDIVTIDASPGRFYDFLTTIEREKAAPAESSPKTNSPASQIGHVSQPEPPPTQTMIQFVSLEHVKPNPWNPNELLGERRAALKEDMRNGGPYAIDPILIRALGGPGRYEIVDGETRWNLARELAWATIRAEIRSLSGDEAKIMCYRKNYERGTLNPLKEAKLFSDEMAKGLSQEAVGKKFGVSQDQVSERLHLLLLPKPVQELVTTRVVKPSHAEVIARIPDPDKQVEAAKRIAEEQLSVRQLEDLVRGEAAPPESHFSPPSEAEATDLPRDRSQLASPPKEPETDTGFEFTCPICKETYRVLCRDGDHSFQEA